MTAASEGGAHGAKGLAGTWRLAAFDLEDQASGARQPRFGAKPSGRLILHENGLMVAILSADGRKVPKTDEDRAKAFNTVIAYSGRYRIDGDQLSTEVDIAWNEAWVGTAQFRSYRFLGSSVEFISPWGPNAADPTKNVRGILVWEREA